MPDEAQQQTEPDPQPERRRTAMQVAQDALQTAEAALNAATAAESAQDNLGGEVQSLSEKVTDLQQRVQDRETAHAELRDEIMGRLSGIRPDDSPTRDQVDARIAEALDASVLPQLKAMREEWGGYSGGMTRQVDDLRRRLVKLEEVAAQVDDAAADISTQALDSMRGVVRRELDNILARLEEVERRPSGGSGVPELTWDAIAERVANEAKVAVNRHLSLVAPAGTNSTVKAVPGVHAKVLEVMRRVDRLEKDRKTESGPKFQYRSIDDAMDAVGHAMREVGLVYTTKVTDRQVHHHEATSGDRRVLWTTVMLTVAYTFIDPVDGSAQTYEMTGEGRDNSDKATSKAAAMALKYGLLHALMIPVQGMPDGDAENPQVLREGETTNPNAVGQAAPARRQQVPSAEARQARAQAAVAALQALAQVRGQERYNRLVAIGNQIRSEGLLDVPATWKGETAPLSSWLVSAEALLRSSPTEEQARAAAEHHQQHPPTSEPPPPGDSQGGYDEPPWEGGY